MKNIKTLTTIIIGFCIISLLSNCSKTDSITTPSAPAVSANFTYSGAGLAAPSTVTFANSSSNATSYKWDFGDNGTSTETNPTHAFLSGGVYTVKLTANGTGGSNSTSKTVNILPGYTKVTITKITISQMPFSKSSGAGWDPFDGPDVYTTISDSMDVLKWDGSAAIANNVASSSLPIAFSCNYVLTNLYAARFIDLWDFDTFGANEPINYVSFRASNYIILPNPYPASVTLTQNLITVKLDLLWQ
jgi:PKD repeat protein